MICLSECMRMGHQLGLSIVFGAVPATFLEEGEMLGCEDEHTQCNDGDSFSVNFV